MPFSDMFHRKTPQEQIKEYQRSIKRSQRDMEREIKGLERQENKLKGDIKKMAKQGQMDSAKVMAKDLVRTRGYIKKMHKMNSHMSAVSMRLATMQSSAGMVKAMKGVTKVMGKMNKKMNLPQMQKIMQEFEKQNEQFGMKEEMMGDAMDDAFADDEDSEEEEQLLGGILAELGVEAASGLASAGTGEVKVGGAAEQQQEQGQPAADGGGGGGGDDVDAELQKRLENLRRT